MTNKEIIEENAKEKRMADSDLSSAFSYNPQTEISEHDIDNVLAAVYGENDGADWYWIVALKDGRHAFLQGGCDYTGWDCQSSLYTVKIGTLDEVMAEVPEDEKYYPRKIKAALTRQLAHELPFGVIES